MTIEETRHYCLAKPGTTEDIKWDNHACFSVGGKLFLITSPDELPCSASFKANMEQFEALTEMDEYMPAPHLARYHWVKVHDMEQVPTREWKQLIDNSYDAVFQKLSKTVKKAMTEP